MASGNAVVEEASILLCKSGKIRHGKLLRESSLQICRIKAGWYRDVTHNYMGINVPMNLGWITSQP